MRESGEKARVEAEICSSTPWRQSDGIFAHNEYTRDIEQYQHYRSRNRFYSYFAPLFNPRGTASTCYQELTVLEICFTKLAGSKKGQS